jgi:5-methylcytosine-specific restriction endonuclease McrA
VGAPPTARPALVTRVLLLNATFEPLQLVSERRAVVLMLAGRAEPIVTPEHPSVCRSASVVVEIPAIVRLHDMVKLPSKVRTPPLTRRSLLLRDSYRCAYCLEHADTIDHVVPRSRGGRHEWTNVVAACRHHNMQKGDRLLEEIGWRMHFEPRVPDGPWWRWRHLPDPDPLWAPYLPRAS